MTNVPAFQKGTVEGKMKQTGIKISIIIDWAYWFFKPRIAWDYGRPHFKWLCLSIMAEGRYMSVDCKDGP